MTVTARRDTALAQNDTSVADLGQMTVTARRDTALAQNDTPHVRRVSF
jgi:hypothetical protein